MRIFLGVVALIAYGGVISAHTASSADSKQAPPGAAKMSTKQVKCILAQEILSNPVAAASAALTKTCSYSCPGMDAKQSQAIPLKQTCPPTMMHTVTP
jgi:hypothetical protein